MVAQRFAVDYPDRLAGPGAVTSGRWLANTVLDLAPRIPVRSRLKRSDRFFVVERIDESEPLIKITLGLFRCGGDRVNLRNVIKALHALHDLGSGGLPSRFREFGD